MHTAEGDPDTAHSRKLVAELRKTLLPNLLSFSETGDKPINKDHKQGIDRPVRMLTRQLNI